MKLNEFRPGIIQPGLEHVIEAGDTLEITDQDGRKFAVTAKDSPEVVQFCKAFDQWLSMSKAHVQGPVIEHAFSNVLSTFHRLPIRVQRELPSWKTLGVKP